MRSQPPAPDSVSIDPRFTIKISEQIRLADARMGNRRGGVPVRRTVTVAIGDFGLESLGGALTRNSANLSRSFVQAVRYYLADQGSGRAGWPYPGFRREEELSQTVEVQVEIDDSVWKAFSKEAEQQGSPRTSSRSTPCSISRRIETPDASPSASSKTWVAERLRDSGGRHDGRRAELHEVRLEGQSTTMVETVDGAFGFPEDIGNLDW